MEENPVHEETFDRAFAAARAYDRHLRREAVRGARIELLLAAGGLRAVLEADVPLRGLGHYKVLLKRSWVVRHENPREMVMLARAAVAVAHELDPRRYDPRHLADFQARAWGELANALRAADDHAEAAHAFGTAFKLLLTGTGEPDLKARLFDLHASFLGARRQFDLALAALDLVHANYLELGDRHLAGRALLTRAIYTHYSGRSEEALHLNQQGIELLDAAQDPDLLFQALHNHLSFLVACGEFREAKRMLVVRQRDLQATSGHVNRVKLRWLQGLISAGLGDSTSAEKAFLETKAGLEEAGMGFHSALVSLDLGLLWMRQGKYRDTQSLVEEATDVFLGLGIHREALGAVVILKDCFVRKKATVALLESVIAFLRRWQINPEAQFNPQFE